MVLQFRPEDADFCDNIQSLYLDRPHGKYAVYLKTGNVIVSHKLHYCRLVGATYDTLEIDSQRFSLIDVERVRVRFVAD